MLYFMEARKELPDEAFVPARLVLDDRVFERVASLAIETIAATSEGESLVGAV
ncbi:MAG: hypothetical protein KIT84_14085 [Labilithrix sp.]|nr:hypothetical protein [Labilithrix sp.]MCW5812150.1 hypothetical protein [Labilithrix sp.]